MLRHMYVRRHLAALVVLLAVGACGNGPQQAADDLPEDTKAHLLRAADRTASANGGQAVRVKAVETTRGAAADLTGHSNLEQQERIWVVQVSGDTYECQTCSRPFGVTADPSGHVIEIVLRSTDWQATDFRIGEHRTDLAVFGEVHVLRK